MSLRDRSPESNRSDLEEGIFRGRRDLDRVPDLASSRPRASPLAGSSRCPGSLGFLLLKLKRYYKPRSKLGAPSSGELRSALDRLPFGDVKGEAGWQRCRCFHLIAFLI